MKMLWFRILLALITALNTVIPSLELNLRPGALPVGFEVERVSDIFAEIFLFHSSAISKISSSRNSKSSLVVV